MVPGAQVGARLLAESLVLSALGGLAGTVLVVAVTATYALSQYGATVVPPLALYGSSGAAVASGGVAGVYPALRAARRSPTEALRTV